MKVSHFFVDHFLETSSPVALTSAACPLPLHKVTIQLLPQGCFPAMYYPLDHSAEDSDGATVLLSLGQYHRDTFLIGLVSVCARGGRYKKLRQLVPLKNPWHPTKKTTTKNEFKTLSQQNAAEISSV